MGIGSFLYLGNFHSFLLISRTSTRKVMHRTETITAAQFSLPKTTSSISLTHVCREICMSHNIGTMKLCSLYMHTDTDTHIHTCIHTRTYAYAHTYITHVHRYPCIPAVTVVLIKCYSMVDFRSLHEAMVINTCKQVKHNGFLVINCFMNHITMIASLISV